MKWYSKRGRDREFEFLLLLYALLGGSIRWDKHQTIDLFHSMATKTKKSWIPVAALWFFVTATSVTMEDYKCYDWFQGDVKRSKLDMGYKLFFEQFIFDYEGKCYANIWVSTCSELVIFKVYFNTFFKNVSCVFLSVCSLKCFCYSTRQLILVHWLPKMFQLPLPAQADSRPGTSSTPR